MQTNDGLILIVEDQQDSIVLLQSIFNYHHAPSVAAMTAEDALEMVNQTLPEVILIDLDLPGMNGWDLLDILRQNPETQHIPAIAMTAYHTPVVAEEALAAGFDAFFAKPIQVASFYQDLQSVLQGG